MQPYILEKFISNDEIRTKKIRILTEVKTLIYVIMLLDMIYYIGIVNIKIRFIL